MAADNPDSKWERPEGDQLLAGLVVVGAVVCLLVMAHYFRDVAPA